MIRQKNIALWETHFPLLMVYGKIVFILVQGRLLLVNHFRSQYELIPFGALCNLIPKMHNTSKFWSIEFMDANFFYYTKTTMCMGACVRKLFL